MLGGLARQLKARYIDVYEYPDGRIELRAGGCALPYVRYEKLPQIDIAALVKSKRLGHALRAAKSIREQQDDRRLMPSRTNRCELPRPRVVAPA